MYVFVISMRTVFDSGRISDWSPLSIYRDAKEALEMLFLHRANSECEDRSFKSEFKLDRVLMS